MIFPPFNDKGVPVDRRTSALGNEVNIEWFPIFLYLGTKTKQNVKTRYDLYEYNLFTTFSGPVLAFEYGERYKKNPSDILSN